MRTIWSIICLTTIFNILHAEDQSSETAVIIYQNDPYYNYRTRYVPTYRSVNDPYSYGPNYYYPRDYYYRDIRDYYDNDQYYRDMSEYYRQRANEYYRETRPNVIYTQPPQQTTIYRSTQYVTPATTNFPTVYPATTTTTQPTTQSQRVQPTPKAIPSDVELQKRIEDALKNSIFARGIAQVKVEVNNGTVDLYGAMQSQDDSTKIETFVRQIDGVKIVNNRINVIQPSINEPDYRLRTDEEQASPISDEELTIKINEILKEGGFEQVYFDIRDGDVILRGTVQSMENIDALDDTIRKLPGVRYLDNRITLAR